MTPLVEAVHAYLDALDEPRTIYRPGVDLICLRCGDIFHETADPSEVEALTVRFEEWATKGTKPSAQHAISAALMDIIGYPPMCSCDRDDPDVWWSLEESSVRVPREDGPDIEALRQRVRELLPPKETTP